MITLFGKQLRKIRLERDMLLKHMADDLNVSTAYLSAVENGKRNVPEEWIDQLEELYNVDKEELQRLAFMSNKTASVELSKNAKANSLLFSFARKFDDLDDDEISTIYEILKNKKK